MEEPGAAMKSICVRSRCGDARVCFAMREVPCPGCYPGEPKCLTSGCGGAWCSGKVALRAVAMLRCMDEHGLVRRICSDDAGVDCYCVLVRSCPDMKLDGGSSCDGHVIFMQNLFYGITVLCSVGLGRRLFLFSGFSNLCGTSVGYGGC